MSASNYVPDRHNDSPSRGSHYSNFPPDRHNDSPSRGPQRSSYQPTQHSRPPRDPQPRPHKSSKRPPKENRSSQGSNRLSGDRDSTEMSGYLPQYEKKAPRSSRPTSSSSADSTPSVYDEIPIDQVAREPQQSKNTNLPKRSHKKKSPNYNTAPGRNVVNMLPSAVHNTSKKPGGNAPSVRSSLNSAGPEMVDLNVSKLSHDSDGSVTSVNLGGIDYPIGSRLGKKGNFVIGDPASYPAHDTTSFRSSQPSITNSTVPIYRGGGNAYSFESWNWTIIRFVIFIILCLIMVALLAAVIAVGIEHKKSCTAYFEWWKGSTFYNLPVPYFYDTDSSNVGDIEGVGKKLNYYLFSGIGAVVLSKFYHSEQNNWDLVRSFTELDPRIGTVREFEAMVETLHERDIKVMIHMCPWYTSKEHLWYTQSKESSIASLNEYKDFYIWRNTPDANNIEDWAYDNVRSQYYLHYSDIERPVLNWKNDKVRNAFNGILELWLKRGVDGFLLCDLNRFYTEDFDFLQRFHSTLSSYSLGEDRQKILAVDSEFITETARLNYRLFEDFVGLTEKGSRTIDMIQTPLYMEDISHDNRTASLVSRIEKTLEWQAIEDGPWVAWDLVQLSKLEMKYVGAVQLLNLMLPGTPSYTAGQEIGLFYLESTARYQAPMVWKSDSSNPFNPGSELSGEQIYALRNLSTTRNEVYSLRFDKIIGDEESGVNIKIMEVDSLKNFILFNRFYTQDKTYYYAANFGKRTIKKDLEYNIAPWATVLADTGSRYYGRLELREVELEPGQAIVFYPTK